jgi:outer membrane biosynthesis protein TonB
MHRRRSLLLIFPLLTLFAIACNNKPNDNAIATEIKAKMFSQPLLKSGSVDVAVKDGVVTLTGTVSDQDSRLAAQDIASKTNGVRQVIDSIAIANPAPPVAEATPAPPPTPSPKPARKKKPAAPKAEPAPATPASDEKHLYGRQSTRAACCSDASRRSRSTSASTSAATHYCRDSGRLHRYHSHHRRD